MFILTAAKFLGVWQEFVDKRLERLKCWDVFDFKENFFEEGKVRKIDC